MSSSSVLSADDGLWANWDSKGKAQFLTQLRQRLPAASDSGSHEALSFYSSGGGSGEIRSLLHQLCWKHLRHTSSANSLNREQVVHAIGEMLLLHTEMTSLVVDVLVLVDAETDSARAEKKDERARFVSLLKDAAERYLPDAVLKERVDIDTLGEAGLLRNPKKFFSTVIKLKTKLFYKQQKFNLFREECEGYAKLVTELNQDLATVTPAEILEVIKSIIGYFNLDPNRVLDLILESFECHLEQHDFFIELLRQFTPDPNTLEELLGFKYKYYTNESDDKRVPDSLFQQTALMIQHGILEMKSIYALLGPDDKAIQDAAEKELNGAKEFVRKANIVSTSGEKKPEEMEVDEDTNISQNQKFGLLKALLTVGAWDEAEQMLSKMPTYYAVSHPEIANALLHLVHTTIEPLHRRHCPQTSKDRSKQYPPLKNKSAPLPAQTFKDFQKTVVPMLLTIGPYAHNDAVLLYKVLRILKASMGRNVDEQISPSNLGSGSSSQHQPPPSVEELSRRSCLYFDTMTLMDEVFLPSLSLTTSNCCLAEEIWSVLRLFPYHYRYRLYGQWKSETYTLHPQLLRKKASMQKKIKYIMQRISKENVKPTSRQLGKLTHSSPGLLFDYILCQLQLYNNLIVPVVDSLKYLTNLSFDVLGYSIIEALNNPEKDRTKHDGTSISLWLQSLSNFCGAVYKKYNIELTGLMQYVANQLKSKKSLDLLILKEVVLKMAGIEAAEEMTSEQIDAMAGGDLLRQEAGSFTQIKNTKKSSQRLKDSLIDNNLAVPLCLLMAQQRNCVVYQETENSHLKLVGKLFDQCQDTLVQFGTFLASTLSVDDYTHRLPAISDLLTRYHVNLDLAFFLARPMFNHQISLKFDELRRLEDKSAWKEKTEDEQREVYVSATTHVMQPVIQAIRPIHHNKIWDDISPQFLTTFWSLTMYDLFVPESIYAKEIAKLKAAPAKVDEARDMNMSRRKREKERLNVLLERMQDEQKRQKEHVERVMARLQKEKDSWFFSRSAKLAKNETITTFLQLCLFPRCIFTASDAIYCAKFVQLVHLLKTPNFSTLICFDRIFCDITYTVTSCTENEAHRYGRFLVAMLEIVMKWHSSKETFERECVGYPGFVTKFRVPDKNGGGAATNSNPSAGDDHVDHENYRHVVHKWHYKMAKALVVCLESKDYVQIRNALTILIKILPFFPNLLNLSGVIEKRIEKVCADEKEQRKDLYLVATSYLGQLKSRKSLMLKEHEFHQIKKGPNATTAAASSSKSKNNSNGDSSAAKATAAGTETARAAKKTASPAPPDSRASKERDVSSSKSRSQSREKSVTKGGDATNITPDRKVRKESKERSVQREASKHRDDREGSASSSSRSKSDSHRDRDRERDRDRLDMGPPTSSSTHRRSVEPLDGAGDKDSKRRKVEHAAAPQDDDSNSSSRKEQRKRERSKEKSRERSLELEASAARREKKAADRKRDRDDPSDSNGLKRSRKDDKYADSADSRYQHNGGELSSSERKSSRSGSSGQRGSGSSSSSSKRK